jgi:hypothetical protein
VNLLRRLARHNGRIIDATVRDITTGWLQAWDDLGPAWQQAVTVILDQYTATGTWPAPWQVARIEAIARATQRTEQSLTRLLTDAAALVSESAGQISAATLAAEPSLITSQTPTTSAADVSVPAARAGSALDARRARVGSLLRPIGASVTAAITWELTHPPNAGRRPAAGMLARIRAGFNAGLTRAVTVVRTETVDTYRTAAGLVHAANPSVVTGWAWICSCDRRSCLACWSMHGTTHPLDDAGPAGHPSCRCMRLPLAEGTSPSTAEAKFRRLSRRDQLKILGRTRHELWRSGAIAWDRLAVRRSTAGWRDSYVPRPVADLQRLAATPTA